MDNRRRIAMDIRNRIKRVFHGKRGMKNMLTEILVKFKNKEELVSHSTLILHLLVEDKNVEYILLAKTKEIIFTQENGLIVFNKTTVLWEKESTHEIRRKVIEHGNR